MTIKKFANKIAKFVRKEFKCDWKDSHKVGKLYAQNYMYTATPNPKGIINAIYLEQEDLFQKYFCTKEINFHDGEDWDESYVTYDVICKKTNTHYRIQEYL